MAVGPMHGKIETRHLRVLHMVGLMAVRGDAFAHDVNAFNGAMNLGNRLSQWFTATVEGVQRYVDGGGAARCSAIAEKVAFRVLGVMQPGDGAS